MKMIYTEPEIEVVIFEKRDCIRASVFTEAASVAVAEDQVGIAEAEVGEELW